MSDVSKTKDLIELARAWAPCAMTPVRQKELITRLADALESTLGEPSEQQVEDVARAIFMTDYMHMGEDVWETARLDGNSDRPDAFIKARAALKAAGVVPDAAIERVRAAKFEVDSVHQIHGTDCLCGFSSARSRSRTEHITEAMVAALDGGDSGE